MLKYLGIYLIGIKGLLGADENFQLSGHCPDNYDCNEDRHHSILNDHFTEIHINKTHTAECFCDAEAATNGDGCADYQLLCHTQGGQESGRKECIDTHCSELELRDPKGYQSCIMTHCLTLRNLGVNPNNLTHPAYVKKQCIKQHCNGLKGIQYRYCRSGYCGKGDWANRISKCVIQPWKKNDKVRYLDKDGLCKGVLRGYRKYFFDKKYTHALRTHIKSCWVDAMENESLSQCVRFSTMTDTELNRRVKDNYHYFMNGVYNVWKKAENIQNTPWGYCLFSMARRMKTCAFRKIRHDPSFDDLPGRPEQSNQRGRSLSVTVPTEDPYLDATIWPSEGDDYVFGEGDY